MYELSMFRCTEINKTETDSYSNIYTHYVKLKQARNTIIHKTILNVTTFAEMVILLNPLQQIQRFVNKNGQNEFIRKKLSLNLLWPSVV